MPSLRLLVFEGWNLRILSGLPALLLLGALALTSETHATDSKIGAWLVHSEKDPFSPKKKTIALTTSSDSGVLAIRCLGDDGLSVMVALATGKKTFDAGDPVPFKYRADEGEIVDDKGQAFGEHNIDMPNARQILADAEKAGTLFIRMDTPTSTSIDLQFKTKGAAKALADIKKDCPLEASKDGVKDEKAAK